MATGSVHGNSRLVTSRHLRNLLQVGFVTVSPTKPQRYLWPDRAENQSPNRATADEVVPQEMDTTLLVPVNAPADTSNRAAMHP